MGNERDWTNPIFDPHKDMREAITANQPIRYFLECQKCWRAAMVEVLFNELYAAMNELGWALIPSHHGKWVQGVCPQCREENPSFPEPEIGTGALQQKGDSSRHDDNDVDGLTSQAATHNGGSLCENTGGGE